MNGIDPPSPIVRAGCPKAASDLRGRGRRADTEANGGAFHPAPTSSTPTVTSGAGRRVGFQHGSHRRGGGVGVDDRRQPERQLHAWSTPAARCRRCPPAAAPRRRRRRSTAPTCGPAGSPRGRRPVGAGSPSTSGSRRRPPGRALAAVAATSAAPVRRERRPTARARARRRCRPILDPVEERGAATGTTTAPRRRPTRSGRPRRGPGPAARCRGAPAATW